MLIDFGKYFLYRHIRLDKNEVFYIGVGTKTNNPNKQNYNEIYRRAFLRAIRNPFWKNIVAKTKYKVEIICESNDYEEIENKEKEFIELYGRRELKNGTLVNMIDGGKGQKSVHLKKHSEETKRNASERMNGKPSPMLGKTMSEESKKKMSEAAKGKIVSENTKQKMSNYHKGKPLSEETKRRMSEAAKGESFCRKIAEKLFPAGNFSPICHSKRLQSQTTTYKSSFTGSNAIKFG